MYREFSSTPLHGTPDEARTREMRTRAQVPSPREVMTEAGLTLAVVAAIAGLFALIVPNAS